MLNVDQYFFESSIYKFRKGVFEWVHCLISEEENERSQRAAIKAVVGKKRKQMNAANHEYKTGQAKEETLLELQAIIKALYYLLGYPYNSFA